MLNSHEFSYARVRVHRSDPSPEAGFRGIVEVVDVVIMHLRAGVATMT
jgi:hypothetical protein